MLATGGRYDSLVASFHGVIDSRPDKSNCDEESAGRSRGQHVTGGVIFVKNLLSVKKSKSLNELPPECALKIRSLFTRASKT